MALGFDTIGKKLFWSIGVPALLVTVGGMGHLWRQAQEAVHDTTRREALMLAEVVVTAYSVKEPPGAAAHHAARDFLVGARGVERIGTRQVDKLDRLARGQVHPPGFPLNSDPGVVGDLLPRAGERVEQRALARVGIADQRGGAQSRHSSATVIARFTACQHMILEYT